MRKFFSFLLITTLIAACVTEPKDMRPAIKLIANDRVVFEDGKEVPLPNQPGTGATTLFIVRHGEKELGDTINPGLIFEGKERANKLQEMLKDVELGGVLSTAPTRSMETARPVAESHGLTIFNYSPDRYNAIYPVAFEFEKGKKFLIVSHSNLIPKMLKDFGGDSLNISIADDSYDNFFIVTSTGPGSGEIHHAKY